MLTLTVASTEMAYRYGIITIGMIATTLTIPIAASARAVVNGIAGMIAANVKETAAVAVGTTVMTSVIPAAVNKLAVANGVGVKIDVDEIVNTTA